MEVCVGRPSRANRGTNTHVSDNSIIDRDGEPCDRIEDDLTEPVEPIPTGGGDPMSNAEGSDGADDEQMRASVFTGVGEIELEERSIPTIADDEVLLRVGACGVCMTDYHIYHGSFEAPSPLVLGHETAGEVAAIGDGVTSVAVGDRVTLNPTVPCNACSACKRGETNLCANNTSIGGAGETIRDGSFAEYVAVPETVVVDCGDLSTRTAALAEPLACCIRAVDRAAITTGDTVVLIGAGPIGLLLTQAFRVAGAGEIIVSELDENRRELALDLGADHAIDPADGDPVEQVLGVDGPVDVACEVVGRVPTIEQAHAMTGRGGRTLIVGVPPQDATIEISPFDIYFDEMSLVGTFALTQETFERAVTYLRNDRIDVSSLITEEFGLDGLETAFERMESTEGLKKLIIPGKSD
jgi:L-iditol 2-dehydrogenase